jgi:hypothetical protein
MVLRQHHRRLSVDHERLPSSILILRCLLPPLEFRAPQGGSRSALHDAAPVRRLRSVCATSNCELTLELSPVSQALKRRHHSGRCGTG